MSSELRTKIANTIQECHRKGIAHYGEIAEHILALEGYIDRTPPATAKLPEGVKIHHAKRTTDSSYFWVGNSTGDMYFSETLGWKPLLDNGSPGSLWTQQEDAVKSALSAPPVPGEKPTNKPDMLRVTVGDGKYTLVQDGEGKQFALRYGEPWRDLVGDGLTLSLGYELDAARARIAELEADNTRLRAQYDMVEQERTRLMLGQQVPYTPAEKPDARNFVATGEQRQDDYYEKPITEMKPDPLARAVTAGEFNEKMQRLADIYVRAGMPTTAKFIRDAFTSTQGAAHAE